MSFAYHARKQAKGASAFFNTLASRPCPMAKFSRDTVRNFQGHENRSVEMSLRAAQSMMTDFYSYPHHAFDCEQFRGLLTCEGLSDAQAHRACELVHAHFDEIGLDEILREAGQ